MVAGLVCRSEGLLKVINVLRLFKEDRILRWKGLNSKIEQPDAKKPSLFRNNKNYSCIFTKSQKIHKNLFIKNIFIFYERRQIFEKIVAFSIVNIFYMLVSTGDLWQILFIKHTNFKEGVGNFQERENETTRGKGRGIFKLLQERRPCYISSKRQMYYSFILGFFLQLSRKFGSFWGTFSNLALN